MGFSGPQIDTDHGPFSVSFLQRRVVKADWTETIGGGLGVIMRNGREKSGYRLNTPNSLGPLENVTLSVLDEDGSVTSTTEVHHGDVILIEDHSAPPVILTRDWMPRDGATRINITNDYRKLLDLHYSGKSREAGNARHAPPGPLGKTSATRFR